jgi:acyl-homoserine lactone acylase PvdQ
VRRVAVAAAVSAAVTLAVLPGLPGPVGAAEADYGEVLDILPPGQSGTVTATDLARVLAGDPQGRVARDRQNAPAHFADQLEMYDALNAVDPSSLSEGDLTRFYKPSTFALPADQVQRVETPKAGVTIAWDTHGVPHVKGDTREDVAWGAGYAGTHDRMFLQDVLRHAGAARSAEFLGPTDANVTMDREQLRSAFYTHDEAAAQVAALPGRFGAEGARTVASADAFLAGVNAAQDAMCPLGSPVAPQCPAEYAALGKKPVPWDRADITYVASLVGGIFGKGGGGEYSNARWLRQLQHRLGAKDGRAVYRDLREKDDTEAPTTASVPYPYGGGRRVYPGRPGVAVPDLHGATAPGTGADAGSDLPLPAPSGRSLRGGTGEDSGLRLDLPFGDLDLSSVGPGLSNALLVAADRTTTGHPLTVFGPQTGYYAPQLLTEIVLEGPGVKARGVSFAGTQLVVQLGRGVDYAWSATSASNDNVDTVVERLCTTDGSPVTVRSTAYSVDGTCTPMDRQVHEETALPNAGATEPPRHLRFEVLRTRHGIVQLRTTVKGRPVAVVTQRSTYRHEVDSVVGFARLNDPDQTHDPASFQRAASAIDYTFNWFYVDSRDISYFSSGLLPHRAEGTDFDLPRWGESRFDWRGWLSPAEHVHQTNPPSGFLASWNNKPAPQWSAADSVWGYGSVYRSMSLSDRARAALRSGGKVSRAGLVGIVADAATVDSRARYTLPMLLDVVGRDRKAGGAVALLRAWLRDGAHRVDRDRDGSYAHQVAIAVFDEWWESQTTAVPGEESVAKEVLARRLGPLVDRLPHELDNHPRGGRGSAWNEVAWYGYLNKDLRRVLGRPVASPYSRVYCGAGSLRRCRADLRASLAAAVSRVLADQGQTSLAGVTFDKHADDIRHVTAGLVGVRPIDWQNRPTFQQVVAFTRHR